LRKIAIRWRADYDRAKIPKAGLSVILVRMDRLVSVPVSFEPAAG